MAWNPAPISGPLQNKMQYDKVVDIINDTKKTGAKFLTGGEIPQGPGYFLPPTLVTDIDESSRLVQEEQFGPIVPIMKFSDVEDALRRANDTRYGLSGSVWAKDTKRGAEIAARLEVGTAWVNQHRATSAFVPFGGAKESGLGRAYSVARAQELHGARGRQRRKAVGSWPIADATMRSPSPFSRRKSSTRS